MDIHFTEQDLSDLKELAYHRNQKFPHSNKEDAAALDKIVIGCLIISGIIALPLFLLGSYMGIICFLIVLFLFLFSKAFPFFFNRTLRKALSKVFAYITDASQRADCRSDGIYAKENDQCVCSFSNIHHIVFYKNIYFLFFYGDPPMFILPRNDSSIDEIKDCFKDYPQIQFEEETAPFPLLNYTSLNKALKK